MPRPKNKEELILAAEGNYQKLLTFIESLPDEKQKLFPEGTLNKNVRDVLTHLHHWHLLFFKWHQDGKKGIKPSTPDVGYTWKTTPDLNREINRMYQKVSLPESFELLGASHSKIMHLINSLSNEQLFTKKYYKWTASTSIGSYLVSATSSHYDWALKLIKKASK